MIYACNGYHQLDLRYYRTGSKPGPARSTDGQIFNPRPAFHCACRVFLQALLWHWLPKTVMTLLLYTTINLTKSNVSKNSCSTEQKISSTRMYFLRNYLYSPHFVQRDSHGSPQAGSLDNLLCVLAVEPPAVSICSQNWPHNRGDFLGDTY